MSAHSHIDAEPSVPAGALSRLTAMGPRLVFSLLLALGSYALVPHPGFFSPRFGVVAFVQGRAQNPFARRVLALFFVKATVALTPEPLRNRIDALVEPRIRPRFAEELRNVKPGYGTALVASIFWSILALTAFFFLIGHLALTALGPRGSLAFVAGTALLWTVFTDNTAGGSMLMYDPFILALWAGVTLAVVRESPIAIDVLVLAAALAKESAVALPLAAWWVAGPDERPRRFALRAAAVALTLAALVYAFRARTGAVLEPHWLDNLAEGARLQRWFQFQAFGPTVAFRGGISLVRPIGLNLLVWIPLLSLAAVGWKDASRPVRWATLVVTTLALPMQFAFCVMHEIRALYELLPWLLWLVALGLARLTRVSQR